MNKAFDKIIEKLEEEKVKGIYDSSSIIGEKNVWDKAIEIVKQEAEQYNNGWIPCSDRLPEVSGEYYTYVYYDGHYMYSVDEIDCDGMVKRWNYVSDYKVVAWKPIEQYQPKGE